MPLSMGLADQGEHHAVVSEELKVLFGQGHSEIILLPTA